MSNCINYVDKEHFSQNYISKINKNLNEYDFGLKQNQESSKESPTKYVNNSQLDLQNQIDPIFAHDLFIQKSNLQNVTIFLIG